MVSNRARVVSLRKKDLTLTQIVSKTGLAKSTVYEYIRKTPLSLQKKLQIKKASRALARSMAARRRGISARSYRKITNWDRNSVFLVSHLLFDGTLQRASVSYQGRSKPQVERVRLAMQKVYDFPPRNHFYQLSGVQRISYYNVSLGEHMQEMARLLLAEIDSLGIGLQREFLRSFFDDEGCIDFRPLRGLRRVRGYQKNVRVLYLVQKLLRNISIDSKIQAPNEVVIVGRKNLITFEKRIGFSKGVRINGKRSNSIWKKSFEKRLLLKRAIASFKK